MWVCLLWERQPSSAEPPFLPVLYWGSKECSAELSDLSSQEGTGHQVAILAALGHNTGCPADRTWLSSYPLARCVPVLSNSFLLNVFPSWEKRSLTQAPAYPLTKDPQWHPQLPKFPPEPSRGQHRSRRHRPGHSSDSQLGCRQEMLSANQCPLWSLAELPGQCVHATPPAVCGPVPWLLPVSARTDHSEDSALRIPRHTPSRPTSRKQQGWL